MTEKYTYDIYVSNINFNLTSENEQENCVRDSFEIFYIKSGEGKLTVESAEYPLTEGYAAVAPPLAYRSVTSSENTPLEYTVVRFDRASAPAEVLPMLDKIAHPEGVGFMPSPVIGQIVGLLERVTFASTLPETEGAAYIRMLIGELIILLSAASGESPTGCDDGLFARVIRYLNDNITADISLDSLSRRFFVSKYYLCRAFKRRGGISIHGYITAKRIALARQLIAAGETASSVAYKVGYGDYSAFYRAYLKQTGESPTGAKQE